MVEFERLTLQCVWEGCRVASMRYATCSPKVGLSSTSNLLACEIPKIGSCK